MRSLWLPMARWRAAGIQERFLDCACRHPSTESAPDEREKSAGSALFLRQGRRNEGSDGALGFTHGAPRRA